LVGSGEWLGGWSRNNEAAESMQQAAGLVYSVFREVIDQICDVPGAENIVPIPYLDDLIPCAPARSI
jgi:hypothetical protein